MPRFKYISKDENARTITGQVVAEDEDAVIKELRRRNLIIVSISELKEVSLKNVSIGGNKVKSDDLVIFARQLSTLVEAGIPILQSLEALEEQVTQAYFKGVIATFEFPQ